MRYLKTILPFLAACAAFCGGRVHAQCYILSPLNDAEFALNQPIEVRWTKRDTPYYFVYTPPIEGVDMQHSPVIKEFRDADVDEFSTIFIINDPRNYRTSIRIGALSACLPPAGQNSRFTVLPDPSVTPTPTPTPVVDPKATPAIKLDAMTVFGSASVADQAITIQPMTIRNEGSVPLEIYDIKPYGYAPELIVLPDGFVPCTVIEPGGSLTLPLLAKADYAELARLNQISVTLLIICNDPDPPSYGSGANEQGCHTTRLRAQVWVSPGSLGLSPQPTPAPYVPPAPCAAPTPTPTPAATVGNNWNLLGSAQSAEKRSVNESTTKLPR